jgi:hypothetical protein
MDDHDANANIQASHSTDSSDASSPTSLVVHSPASPANSSTNPSTTDLQHSYQPYEDDGVQTDVQDSPILIDDDDDASLIDPTSPVSSSALTTHRYTPQYHRIRGTDTFIQFVNTQADVISSAEDAQRYEMEEPFEALASSFPSVSKDEEYIVSQGQFQRLQAHHLVTTPIDAYQQPSSADLVVLDGTRVHPISSVSPGDYSEHSLSPETPNVEDIPMFRTTSSAAFLPSFSASLKSSSPATALQLVTTSSPLQISATTTAGSLNSTSVIHHQSYPVHAELLPNVKMEERLENERCAPGTVVTTTGQDVMDMMTWWEQEQKLRLITSVATSSS